MRLKRQPLMRDLNLIQYIIMHRIAEAKTSVIAVRPQCIVYYNYESLFIRSLLWRWPPMKLVVHTLIGWRVCLQKGKSKAESARIGSRAHPPFWGKPHQPITDAHNMWSSTKPATLKCFSTGRACIAKINVKLPETKSFFSAVSCPLTPTTLYLSLIVFSVSVVIPLQATLSCVLIVIALLMLCVPLLSVLKLSFLSHQIGAIFISDFIAISVSLVITVGL